MRLAGVRRAGARTAVMVAAALAVTGVGPARAWAQACCAGATAIGTTRLAPHEDAVVGVSARAFTLFGSVSRDGAYVGAPEGVVDVGLEQSFVGALRVLRHGQVSFVVPIVETYRKVPGLGEIGGGLGDVMLGARYDFVEPGASATWPGIALALSLTLPTGRSPEEATSPLATDATGTGGAAAGGDLFLERGFGDGFVQVVGSALWRAQRSVLNLYSQRGLTFSGFAAGGYSFPGGLVAAVTLVYRAELDGRLDGATVPGSGHELTRGGLAAGISLSDDWRLQGAVFADLPVAPLSRNHPASTGVSLTLLRSAW